MYTNINLSDGKNQFIYILNYENTGQTSSMQDLGYVVVLDKILFNSPIYRNCNEWVYNSCMYQNSYMPKSCKMSEIKVYFPQFSIETFNYTTYYALDISLKIRNKDVILGTYIFNRSEALAANKVMNFYNDLYYENVTFNIIDPWEVMYSDDWKEFRINLCNSLDKNGEEFNFDGSILNMSLHPVEKIEDKYILCNNVHGGQNAFNLSHDQNNHLKLQLKCNVQNRLTSEPAFECNLLFNESYNNSLTDYILETYQLKNFSLKYELIIGNEDDLYGIYDSGIKNRNYPTSWLFNKSQITNTFPNGIGWKEGINVKASLNVLNESGENVLCILSNSIPLTPDIFKYFVGGEEGWFTFRNSKVNNIKA